jgi:uncharacterized coiled-coil DUF342 family protein
MRNRIFGYLIVLFIGFCNGCTVVDTELLELVLEIKNQNKELLEEVKALQAKSDSLINELKNSAAKQEEVLKKVTDLQAELAKVLAQIGTLNQQLSTQNADLDEIKSQLADLQKKYEGILKQLEELQKLSQILAEIEKLKRQLAELDGKYQVIQVGLTQNKEQLDALKGQVTSLQSQLAENLTKISQLTSQLGEQGADIEKILRAIEELKKSCDELLAQFQDLLNNSENAESYTWKKLIETSIKGFTSTYAFDREKRVIYFLDVGNKYLGFYSIETNQFTEINVSGFPSMDRSGNFIFNPSRQTIQFWRAGRENIYEVSRNGGQISQIGSGSFDAQLYGSNPIFNGISNKPAFINGYGFFSVKNSAYELGTNSWIEKRPNNTAEPFRRISMGVFPNKNFSKAYMIDGYGNQSGSQFEKSCSTPNGLPAANDLGIYCWFRDIWEFDLTTWQARKILPIGSNFEETGNYGFDYQNEVFYSFGGFVLPTFYKQETPNTNKLRKYDPKKDQGWVTIQQKGDIPNLDSGTVSFYDEVKNRFIVVLPAKGVWELKL